MGKIKVLCIQPHSDDVLFSAAHFLFDEKYQVEILTIENNEKRVKEDIALYNFLNIPYLHLTVPFQDESFYSFHKKYKEVNSDNSLEHLIDFFGEKKITEISDEVTNFVKKYLKKNKETKILVPYGIGHPMHCFIRDIVEISVNDKKDVLYYRDFPHSYKKRAKSQLELQSLNYELLESVPVSDFHDIKWNLAKKYYKTQSGVLWFEQGYIKKELPEEVYVKK